MKLADPAGLAATLAFLLALGGCGGGGDSPASGGTGGTGISAVGVMTKGSIIVNGIRFEDTTANIAIDDTPKSAAALKDGMVVRLTGRVNEDGITGTAERVEAQVEVRGTATAVDASANPQSFVVLGQTVLVDDVTVFSNLTGVNTIVVGTTLLEVHGLRDTAGRIRATRVEANAAQMGDDTVDEIRGVVAGSGGGTNPPNFTLGSQIVSAAGAAIAPVGATYQDGSVVEVHCNVRPCVVAGVFQASRIEVEAAEDAPFQPGAGGRMEAEGLISGFTAHPGSFSVGGTPVTTSAATRFEGGIAADLADNVKVEAEGTWNGTTLVASKIEFKRTVVRLQGAPANVNVGAQTFDLQIANNSYVVKIERDSLTNGGLPGAVTCVQVRGQRKVGASTLTVTAGEISASCSNSDRHFIQAPVEAESGEVSMTLLGFALGVGTSLNGYRDVNENSISRTAFFNAVTPPTVNAAGVSQPGTLVKVVFEDGGNSVREAEIED